MGFSFSCQALTGGYPSQALRPGLRMLWPLVFSHLARNPMSSHDVTTHACDPVSAYTLALHLLRKISVTLTAAGSIIQQTCGSICCSSLNCQKKWHNSCCVTLTAWMLEGRCRWLCCWGCRWRAGVSICQLLPNCWSSHSKYLGLLLKQKGVDGYDPLWD